MTVSQPCGHWWHGDNHVNYVLGMWFHAVQLSTTFIPSRKFRYLLHCSAVDIQTHSFTIQTRVKLRLIDLKDWTGWNPHRNSRNGRSCLKRIKILVEIYSEGAVQMLKKYQICFALFLKPKFFYNLQLIVIHLVADK